MAKYKGSKCPEPINGLLDILGAVSLGAYAKNKLKRDYAKGEGNESLKAATMVFGTGALHRGSRGIINLGGLIGINSAVNEIKQGVSISTPPASFSEFPELNNRSAKNTVRKNLWRDYCEDGSAYGLSPEDYETADDYEDALNSAKLHSTDD